VTDRHRHTPDARRSRPAVHRPLHRARTPDAVRRSVEAALVRGGQGRTGAEVSLSAEAALCCAMAAGVVALVVVLGHIAGWFA
jgi:hypothetical protein